MTLRCDIEDEETINADDKKMYNNLLFQCNQYRIQTKKALI